MKAAVSTRYVCERAHIDTKCGARPPALVSAIEMILVRGSQSAACICGVVKARYPWRAMLRYNCHLQDVKVLCLKRVLNMSILKNQLLPCREPFFYSRLHAQKALQNT